MSQDKVKSPPSREAGNLEADIEDEGGEGSLFSWSLILVFVVALDAVRVQLAHFDPFERYFNYHSLWLGVDPAPVFWVAIAAEVAGFILMGRLIMGVIPASSGKPRLLTGTVGLAAAGASYKAFEYAGIVFISSRAGTGAVTGQLIVFLIMGLIAAMSASFLAAAGVTEGGRRKGMMPGIWLRLLPAAVFLGGLVFAARAASYFLLAVPLAGAPLRVGLNLVLGLAFFHYLARRESKWLRTENPGLPGLGGAFTAFVFTASIVGLAIAVPGPSRHSDAIEPVPPVLIEKGIHFGAPEIRDRTAIIGTDKLDLIVTRAPFSFALTDKNKRVLAKLETNPALRESGVSLNFEPKALLLIPGRGAGEMIETTALLSATTFEPVGDLEIEKSAIIAHGRVGSQPVAVSFAFQAQNILRVTVESGAPSPLRSASITLAAGMDERFIGAGAGMDKLDLKGSAVSLLAGDGAGDPGAGPGWLERWTRGRMRMQITGGGVWPVPFVYLSRGLGAFLAESVGGRIELMSASPGVVTFKGRGGVVSLYLIAGSSPLTMAAGFQNLITPKPGLEKSGPGVLEPWLQVPAAQVCQGSIAELEAARQNGVPARNVMLAGVFPETSCAGLPEAVAKGKALGFNFTAFGRATISPDDPGYDEAARSGLLVMNRVGLPYHYLGSSGAASVFDFTNPKTAAAKKAGWQKLREAGVSGAFPDHQAWLPPDAQIYQGGNGRTMRNLFVLAYAAALRDALPEGGPVIARAGFSGMERSAAAGMIGPSADDEVWGRAARKALVRIMGLSVGGMSVVGQNAVEKWPASDKARESLLPSLGLASLSPLFILPPGLSGLPAGDRALEELKFLAETHARMTPLFYSLALSQAREGTPALFPPVFLEPIEQAWFEISDQFMLGPGLMAALPAAPGEASRMVRFPPGRWLQLETLEVWKGAEKDIPRKSGRPLLFLREGNLLPLFPEAFDTLAGSAAPGVRVGSLDREISLTALYGADADFTLFDGTVFTLRHAGDTIVLRAKGGRPRPYTLRLMDCPAPVSVTFAGGAAQVYYKYLDRSRVLTVSGIEGADFQLAMVIQ